MRDKWIGDCTTKLLYERSISAKLSHCPWLDGMLPWRKLSLKCSFNNFVKFPIENEKFPENLFVCKYIILKFWSSPTVGGTVPDTWLFCIYRICKSTNFLIPDGILPDILLLLRANIWRVVEKLLMHTCSNTPKLLELTSNTFKLVALAKEHTKFKSWCFTLPRLLNGILNWESLCRFSK